MIDTILAPSPEKRQDMPLNNDDDRQPRREGRTESPAVAPPWYRQVWWRIFLIGIALYFLTTDLLMSSGNPNFAPTVMLLGAFLVPVTFVTYLYENDALYDVSPIAVGLTFIYGGILGTVTAQLLEQQLVVGMGVIGMLAVGVSEEIAKLVGVVWLARRREFSSELHGIVLGAAAGMGFAALETMGYAFTYFILSRGSMDVLGQVLLSRGLLAPFAHGTWTAILAGTLWRERARFGSFRINRQVLKAFGLVVLLHALWDWSAGALPIDLTLPGITIDPGFLNILVPSIDLPIPSLLIGLWGILVLGKMIREGWRASRPAAVGAGSQNDAGDDALVGAATHE